ncbi:MAG: putative peptide modification system cyclase [Rudaea sp.]
MNAVAEAQPQFPATTALAPVLRTVVVCDLADSAQLTQRLGDAGSAELAQRLDRLARDLIYRHRGREIDKSDGFLLLFERPVQAVAFALDYQRGLRELAQAESLPLSARIGIHVGDVLLWENTPDDVARGAKPVEVEGLAKSVAARLMSLALPGQILLSAIACTLAQRAQSELVAQRAPPRWKPHGRYLFKGVAEAMRVYEVGETGVAPLKRPAWTGKAHREVPWWRRPGILAVEAMALVAAIAIPGYLWLRSPPALAFADRDWVVIGDLHNLTSEIVLDGSLETAFRLGLEQSRYVNVMSDLKVRDTLALMQRDPAHTRINRAVGSEVAIREGARALILPTVAEVGGHVRVTAEVIDPKTQATVYTESADGHGLNSVLPTIDAIDRKLRLRLGEALAAVSATNKPLEQVATANLDALRAYSLGQRAYFTGNMKDALAFYRDAVRLDPQFATAHLVIARVWINADQNSDALKQIELAAATPNRLSARDSLLVDAWRSTLTVPDTSLPRWKSLTELYPDFYPGSGPYAYFAWCANDYADALASAKLNIAPQNAYSAAGQYLLGMIYLATDEGSKSLKYFQLAAQAKFLRNDFYAESYAAQRRFDDAYDLLKNGKPSGVATDDLGTQMVLIALAADRGNWHDTQAALGDAKRSAENLGAPHQQRVRGIELGLRSEFEKVTVPELIRYADVALSQHPDNVLDAAQARFHALFSAWLLARDDDKTAARDLLAKIDPASSEMANAVLKSMRTIVEAELLRSSGHADQAIKLLQPLIDGRELYITHLALLDAYAGNRDNARALDEAHWLAEHRGRAYAEYGFAQFTTAFNVVQSDLVLLRAAELALDLKNAVDARQSLAAFEKAWPDAQAIPSLGKRLNLLHKGLE